MKRKLVMIILSGVLSLSVVGCQNGSSPGNAAKPASSPVPAATASSGQKAAGIGGITQEEAGIKLRVDMPEIKPFLEQSKAGPIVPALLQKAVPQGIGFIEEKNWIVVSHYREGGLPSLLTVIDAESGKMVKALELYMESDKPYTGHAGGVTASKRHVWVSSDGHAYRLKLEDIIQAKEDGKLTFGGSIRTDTRASFTTYADGVLWVGEYANGIKYPTEKSHHMNNRDGKEHRAWAVGYKLDEQTDLLPASKEAQPNALVVPDYILSIPNSIQGMMMTPNSIWLSQSAGQNAASTLMTHGNVLSEAPHDRVAIGSATVPLWFIDSKNKKRSMEIPPMSEGIVHSKGMLYVLFESGASMYKASSSYALDRIYQLKMND